MTPSSYTIFAEKIRGKNLSQSKICKRFLEEVDKGDYRRREGEAIVEFLMEMTSGKPYPV